MSDNNNHPLGEAPRFHVILSTGFGAGCIPIAPGTAGAIVALVIWWIGYCYLPVNILFWATLITTCCNHSRSMDFSSYGEILGRRPRTVVIDEFIGVWIPALIAPCGEHTWVLALLVFVLFRIIDIFKPLGCRWVDQNVKGGWGVMLDDALAGFYALISVFVIKLIFFEQWV